MKPLRDDSQAINAWWFYPVGATPGAYTNDDQAALQAALDYGALFAAGRRVYIPRGLYKIQNSLIIGSHTTVYGEGIGLTTLRGVAGVYAGVDVNGTDVQATLGAG